MTDASQPTLAFMIMNTHTHSRHVGDFTHRLGRGWMSGALFEACDNAVGCWFVSSLCQRNYCERSSAHLSRTYFEVLVIVFTGTCAPPKTIQVDIIDKASSTTSLLNGVTTSLLARLPMSHYGILLNYDDVISKRIRKCTLSRTNNALCMCLCGLLLFLVQRDELCIAIRS